MWLSSLFTFHRKSWRGAVGALWESLGYTLLYTARSYRKKPKQTTKTGAGTPIKGHKLHLVFSMYSLFSPGDAEEQNVVPVTVDTELKQRKRIQNHWQRRWWHPLRCLSNSCVQLEGWPLHRIGTKKRAHSYKVLVWTTLRNCKSCLRDVSGVTW